MNCTAFISLLTKLSTDKIVSGLFRLGYGVAPASKDGYLLWGSDSPAAVLTVLITGDNIEPSALREKIKVLLNENEISYYSIIVVGGMPGIAWTGSNISLNKIRQRIVAKKDVPHLKLVRQTPPPIPETK